MEQLSDTDTLVKKVSIIPLEVVVRNVAAGSLVSRLGLAEGAKLAVPVLEYSYKNDALNDPLVNDYHIAALRLATPEELKIIAG
uniref:phosphoribosylaminoimidazolesuccinocarboxamide synthase n=1 Tax=Treponema endosymbiont of Eucomonympha sp. TaxID=1580831 RepID=UPI000AF72F52